MPSTPTPSAAGRPDARHVLVAFHENVLGGATRSVMRIVPLLEARGWTFSFWANRPSRLYDELEALGHSVAGAPRPIAYSLENLRRPPGARRRLTGTPGYLRAFKRHLGDSAPALVHANSLYCLVEALVAGRRGLPTLLHVHEMTPPNWKGSAGRSIARRRLSSVVAVSRASAAALTAGGNSPRIVYEGAQIPEQPVELRADPRPFRVGTVGVISTRKGSDLFVDAAAALSGDGREIEFEIVGAPTDVREAVWATEVLRRARKVGIAHSAEADVFAKLAGWDAFVLPSRRDPFPIAMLEAMASGVPVIGARVDGIEEQITPGTGVLVEPEDVAALARAIGELASAPFETRAAIAAAARRRVAENFTLPIQAEAMERAYLAALGGRMGGDE